MAICQKILTLHAPPFKSLKVIGTAIDQSATYDFLLVLVALSLTIFEIKGNICEIFPPLYI